MNIENKEILSKYLTQINKISPICDKEFSFLYKNFKDGDEKAKRRLIEGNLRFVIMVALKYQNLGLTLMDLIEEGNIGLIKAVEKYDIERGTKFSTYAIWWIKQRIKRALDTQTSLIKIPSYAVQNIRRCVNYWDDLVKDGDLSNINISQTSKDLDLTMKEVKNALHSLDISNGISSLDSPISQDENISIADIVIEDAETNAPENILEREMDLKMITELFDTLTDKEKIIIESRFGLNNADKRTLTEIGDELGISRERVRQIANIAIEKMKKIFEKDYL
jgi:RNA polymerase primary sigma factor